MSTSTTSSWDYCSWPANWYVAVQISRGVLQFAAFLFLNEAILLLVQSSTRNYNHYLVMEQ